MLRNIFLFFLTITVFTSCKSRLPATVEFTSTDSLQVMFYNVENLFDTLNTEGKNDAEFTPEGLYNWNTEKYFNKLENLSRVLLSANEMNIPPAVIGLCEVENKEVVLDLFAKTPLSKYTYEVVHEHSPDRRGIDVAFAYRPDIMQKLFSQVISVNFPFRPNSYTRDILYVKTLLSGTDTLHFFVNHWPSRAGGQKRSEPLRLHSAGILRNKIDSILFINPEAAIIVMGDFNDSPTDSSIYHLLQAKPREEINHAHQLINLMYEKALEGEGTYNYRGKWDMLDQLMVSRALNDTAGEIFVGKAGVARNDFLLNEKGIPFRMFEGNRYLGGYSDHLPVYLWLMRKKHK